MYNIVVPISYKNRVQVNLEIANNIIGIDILYTKFGLNYVINLALKYLKY